MRLDVERLFILIELPFPKIPRLINTKPEDNMSFTILQRIRFELIKINLKNILSLIGFNQNNPINIIKWKNK